jgi:hypothetical protein
MLYRHYYDWNYSISITSYDEKRRGVGERRGEGDERVGERRGDIGECNGEDDGVAVWLVVCDKLISWAIS